MTSSAKSLDNLHETIGPPKSFVKLYALGDDDGRTVKLGYSKSVDARMAQHQRRGPKDEKMHFLCAWWGTVSDESYLKNHFKHLALRNRKEWFLRDKEMSSWLSFMMKQHFVATIVDEINEMAQVDGHIWLPGGANKQISESRQPSLPLFESKDPFGDLRPDEIGEGDFYSPGKLVEAARACLGRIDLDPASCRLANTKVRAENFYSKKENGLMQEWWGNIWINPPFPWEPWVGKLIEELDSGRVNSIIALSETRVTTAKYFRPIIIRCSALLKMNGRLNFWGPKAGKADEGHELFYFGSSPDSFVREFSKFGSVFLPALSSDN